jgi:hypothetical protein
MILGFSKKPYRPPEVRDVSPRDFLTMLEQREVRLAQLESALRRVRDLAEVPGAHRLDLWHIAASALQEPAQVPTLDPSAQ